MSLVATNTIFSRIVSGSDVETWCIELCRKWASTYIAEAERQHGIEAGFYARPRSYTRTISFDKFPEDQLPALMLVSTGITGQPTKEGDGRFTARWLMGLGLLCSAQTLEESHDMARLFTAAIRELFNDRQSLDGWANGTTWLDERYDDLGFDESRSLSSGQAHFAVEVSNVGATGDGPATPDVPLTPDTSPWPLWPLVETVDVEVDPEGEV